MKTSEFQYHLPAELIAQKPSAIRSQSRLMHYNRQKQLVEHRRFSSIIDLIAAEDCLVFNNTRVIPARLFGRKSTGGKVEILIERILDENHCLAQVRASKTPKTDSLIRLDNVVADEAAASAFELRVCGRRGQFFELQTISHESISEVIETVGHMPLPPYIERDDTVEDHSRYQTVYAQTPGAVAAPTAGLHFDEDLLEKLCQKGVSFAYVTLHVGAGTFQPVRSVDIEDHQMHHEYIEVPQETVERCNRTREQGGRIIAVGTTSVRSLESASRNGKLSQFQGDSDIFIYPGYTFNSVDAMITNFHLPQSTLLMLVSAFAGKDEMLRCYQTAVEEQYRFFSYGDAMFIE